MFEVLLLYSIISRYFMYINVSPRLYSISVKVTVGVDEYEKMKSPPPPPITFLLSNTQTNSMYNLF